VRGKGKVASLTPPPPYPLTPPSCLPLTPKGKVASYFGVGEGRQHPFIMGFLEEGVKATWRGERE